MTETVHIEDLDTHVIGRGAGRLHCAALDVDDHIDLRLLTDLAGRVVGCLFGGGEDRNLTLPKRPTRFQKAIAYVLVMMGYAFWARQEGQFINYAFRVNAGDILKW